MKALAAFMVVLTAIPALAEARMHHPYRGHRIIPAGSAPLDSFTTPAGAYSFRKLRTAYAGNAARIRRASDNAELDIGFVGYVSGIGSPWNEATANAHCAATTCFIRTWYDQSGNARDLIQATAASQPQVIFGCQNSLACFRTTGTQSLSQAGTITPATGLASFSAVAQRTAGLGLVGLIRENGAVQRLQTSSTSGQWTLGPGPSFSAVAAEGVWHAGNGITSPVAGQSVINVDGVETTGTTSPTTVAGAVSVVSAAGTTVNHAEAVVWDNYALTAGERAALVSNQRSFWGF